MTRVEGGARPASPGADEAGRGRGRFDEALARAERSGRGDERKEAARAEPRPREARRPRALAAAPEAAGEPPRAALPPELPRAAAIDVAPVAELAAAVRVVPLAVAALRSPGEAPLALSFGRSLDVELRATPAGVDVVLLPAPGLARAAEAELPRLVAALRVRGVTVAHAEVRSRGRPGGRAR